MSKDPHPLERAISTNRKLRPRTKELYLQHVHAFLAFTGDTACTTATVKAWLAHLRKKKLRPQSINVALNAVRFAARQSDKSFTDAIAMQPLKPNKKGSAGARPAADRALSWEEGVRLVAACAGQSPRDLRDRALILLGLRTGMLRFSICALQITDLQGADLTFEKRGGDQHTLALDAETKTALKAWVGRLALQGITDGPLFRSLGRFAAVTATTRIVTIPDDANAGKTKRARVAAISVGSQLTPDGLYRILKSRAALANLNHLSPHIFRATFLAWATAYKATPYQIYLVTGQHSDLGHKPPTDEEKASLPANTLLPALLGG